MNRRYIIFFVLFSLSTSHLLNAQHRIVLFFTSYPSFNKQEKDITSFLAKGQTHKAIHEVLQATFRNYPVGGMIGTYAGYIGISGTTDGQMIFPRKHQRPVIKVIITPYIKPVLMLGTTIHHWELLKELPVAMYTIELKQDAETKLFFWKITPTQPTDNRVPLDSIVLFAKPENIYLPIGITITNAPEQLILPDIYVKNGFDVAKNAMDVLLVKHFFEPILRRYKAGTPQSWLMQIQK